MANTRLDYNGMPAYLNNDNTNNVRIYTSARTLFLNQNCVQTFAATDLNNAYMNYSILKRFNFEYVNYAYGMFYGVNFQGVPDSTPLNFPNIGNTATMFQAAHFNAPLTLGNKWSYASYMFENCKNFNQNIKIGDNVNDVTSMFSDAGAFNAGVVFGNNANINATNMFNYCSNLVNGQNIIMPTDERVINCTNMFRYCRNLTEVPNMQGFRPVSCVNMYSFCFNLRELPDNVMPIVTNPNVSRRYSASSMFLNCNNLRNVNITIPAGVSTCLNMFQGCLYMGGNIYININSNQTTHSFSNMITGRYASSMLNIYSTPQVIANIRSGSNSRYNIMNMYLSWEMITNGYRNTLVNVYLYNNWTGNV